MLSAAEPIPDLNDLYFFAMVVEHGGFSAAGRALGVPKSRLSKRIAALEDRLGVRMLQRTTRKFTVTEVGQQFYEHCRAVIEEARAAQEAVDTLRVEPRVVVRLTCPISLAQTVLAFVLPEFLARYPKVQVQMVSTDRRVDLIGEGVDIAIRVRTRIDTDATMVMRSFGLSRVLPVASPGLLDRLGRPQHPSELALMPTLSIVERDAGQHWELIRDDGLAVAVDIRPVLRCGEFNVILQSAIAGIGVAMLPEFVCAHAITQGTLEVLLPEWSAPEGTMHFVYPSRREQLPAVRALVEFLADRLPDAARQKHEACRQRSEPWVDAEPLRTAKRRSRKTSVRAVRSSDER